MCGAVPPSGKGLRNCLAKRPELAQLSYTIRAHATSILLALPTTGTPRFPVADMSSPSHRQPINFTNEGNQIAVQAGQYIVHGDSIVQ
jgi:hypothetical protein